MGRTFIPPLAQVDLGHPVGVDGLALVRIDHNYEETRVGVNHLGLVAGLQVPEDRGIIEEGEVDHVLNLFKLGRVDPTHLRNLVGEFLMAYSNNTLAGWVFQIPRLQKSFPIALCFGIRDPDRLLGIIDLALICPLHIHGRKQILSWVRIRLTRLYRKKDQLAENVKQTKKVYIKNRILNCYVNKNMSKVFKS